MQYTYVEPPLPSIARWRHLYQTYPGNSAIRVLEYEILETLALSGKVLDIGGGDTARYAQYLPDGIDLSSVNIDESISPTYLIAADGGFPIPDDSFDAAICFNTLEHIYDAVHTLSEAHRVLKPGATLNITVPFMFRIHGHPDDYFRATPSWWRETLHRVGYSKVALQPLVWGRSVSAGSIGGYRGLLPKRVQFHVAHLLDVLYAAAMFRGKRSYTGRRGERICGVSLGWFIWATK
jgi:SAM-dependent methyltransferase